MERQRLMIGAPYSTRRASLRLADLMARMIGPNALARIAATP
jgi:hypothetical protein